MLASTRQTLNPKGAQPCYHFIWAAAEVEKGREAEETASFSFTCKVLSVTFWLHEITVVLNGKAPLEVDVSSGKP